jgi:hypothetical protein
MQQRMGTALPGIGLCAVQFMPPVKFQPNTSSHLTHSITLILSLTHSLTHTSVTHSLTHSLSYTRYTLTHSLSYTRYTLTHSRTHTCTDQVCPQHNTTNFRKMMIKAWCIVVVMLGCGVSLAVGSVEYARLCDSVSGFLSCWSQKLTTLLL